MENTDIVPRYLAGSGVEIGAFKTPIPGIRPVYVDRFANYAGEPTHADFYGDACELPFHDSSLRYVASSHVLEHVANPFAALAEWFRVLKHGGCIYMVVPDRRRTFDHARPLTDVAHMLADFRNGTTQSDATHIDDFVHGVDWRTFSP
ncbi:MAG TPA: methyltransferase domain-containing protein, partial [Opitutaceae bacterium]